MKINELMNVLWEGGSISLRIQIIESIHEVAVSIEADKGEKDEQEALKFMETLQKKLDKNKTSYQEYFRNTPDGDRVDRIVFPLPVLFTLAFEEKKWVH